jgi:hypothetical protein
MSLLRDAVGVGRREEMGARGTITDDFAVFNAECGFRNAE